MKSLIFFAMIAALAAAVFYYNRQALPVSSAPQTLDEARERTITRLKKLRAMNEDDWQKERAADPARPATLEEAIAKNQAILMQLYDIDQEDWDRLSAELEQQKALLKDTAKPTARSAGGGKTVVSSEEYLDEEGSPLAPAMSSSPKALPALHP